MYIDSPQRFLEVNMKKNPPFESTSIVEVIKIKHSKNLICEGYLKERTLQEPSISLNTLIILTYNAMKL